MQKWLVLFFFSYLEIIREIYGAAQWGFVIQWQNFQNINPTEIELLK